MLMFKIAKPEMLDGLVDYCIEFIEVVGSRVVEWEVQENHIEVFATESALTGEVVIKGIGGQEVVSSLI